jgi:hypothetical protein
LILWGSLQKKAKRWRVFQSGLCVTPAMRINFGDTMVVPSQNQPPASGLLFLFPNAYESNFSGCLNKKSRNLCFDFCGR